VLDTDADYLIVGPPRTHDELARLLGTNRSTVERILREW
jgi:predicted transcriptional regulator